LQTNIDFRNGSYQFYIYFILMMENFLAFPELIFQAWQDSIFEQNAVQVSVLRADLIHPWIQGNKWYKLQYFIKQVIQDNKDGFVSIGGPFSNHLIAIAFAAKNMNRKAIFFIRGGREEWAQNPAVQQMETWGAVLIPVSRTEFRILDEEKIRYTWKELNNFIWVPMGGSSFFAVSFVEEWARKIAEQIEFDVLVLPVATAGTVAGFASGLPFVKKIEAIEVLQSNGFLQRDMGLMLEKAQRENFISPKWQLDYHFGGYAKTNVELSGFCKRLFVEKGFPVEPIYSGKAFYAVLDLAQKGYFQEKSRILLVHTGGVFPWNMGR